MTGRSGEEWRAAPRAVLPWAVLCSGPLAAVGVLVVARLQPDVAVLGGCLFSGGVAVVCGALVLLGARARGLLMRLPLLLIAVAMIVWGIGQALVGYAAASGTSTFPTPGDALSTVAAPIGIVGLLLALRGGSRHAGSLRFALDSVLLGSALALVIWRAGFSGSMPWHGGTSDVTALVMLLLEAVLVSLLLLAYLRDLDTGMLLATCGMALYSAADLRTIHAVAQPGGQWPWVPALLWCLAWPFVATGMLRFRPRLRRDDDWYESDTRVTSATALLSVLAIGVFVALGVSRPDLDPPSLIISVVVIVAFGAREAVSGWQRRRLLRTLTTHAVRDPLTELLNRRGLLAALQDAERSGGGSLLTLDLDGFKELNDILGHTRGDDLLVAVSRRVEACLPPDAQAFRIGGDEFAVVVPGAVTDGADVAERMLAAVRQASVDVPGAAAVGVTTSVGVARLGMDQREANELGDPATVDVTAGPGVSALTQSSAALRAAKLAGRNRVEFYDGQVAASHRRTLLVERRLHDAVRQGDIDVHYQPILDLESGRVTGVEALARWTDPLLGRVGPDEFIAQAEHSGLIRRLGSAVLRRAVDDIMSVAGDLPDLSLAVNASTVQVRQPDFADEVLDVLHLTGLSPDRLVVEVTESVFVDADDPAIPQLTRLRERGVHVAIDDFGSGFSALAYLSRLPASVLKIDQTLTRQVVDDARSLAVLQAVVSLAHTMPMSVVVEGIETGDVADLVRSTGAGHGQGWLYSPAVPVDELVAVVSDVHAAMRSSHGTSGLSTSPA